jgi:hypothetical protein
VPAIIRDLYQKLRHTQFLLPFSPPKSSIRKH